MAISHAPVMVDETVAALCTDRAGAYVDATFGRGGHARALLAQLSASARLLVIDRDPAAIEAARALAAQDARVVVQYGQMSEIEQHVDRARLQKVVGVVMDLGVSSPQLDDPARGFSFRADGPLDMRMDNTTGQTAAAWLAHASESELTQVFRDYGEERFARRIAQLIVTQRKQQPLTRTQELVALVNAAQPHPDPFKHSATRVFQAIRIHINDELGELRRALDGAFTVLVEGGRLAVISFHSLEDRIVKQRFDEWVRGRPLPRRLPVTGTAPTSARSIVRGRRASDDEVTVNPRARSAMLRVIEKCQGGGAAR
jgi:16S rRNA (cytosine1402-N4)-methyltransferase